MPTTYSGRVTTILVVLLLSLWAIFPGGNPFKPDLKPGIDMVGGTSLLYEIKVPEGAGGQVGSDLAERVMASLKKRVDPDGVRNLIWRPQGNTRLEIQMPLTKSSGEADKARAKFLEAQRAVDATNVRPNEVIAAVEELKGDARRDRLNALAGDSDVRQKLFAGLASYWDQVQDARDKKDSAKQAEAEDAYEALQAKINDTNLSSSDLQNVLDLKPELRKAKLDEIKAKFAGSATRVKAIDEFVGVYDGYSKLKGSIDSAADLKRLLRGSGVLEFHILASPGEYAGYQNAVDRLKTDGPQVRANDDVRWYPVDRADEFKHLTQEYNDKRYVLAYTTPDKALVNREGQAKWALARAYPINENAQREVGFEFDAQGSRLFGELTGNNIGRPLGILLDGKMISAPNINSQILGRGSISGNREAGGFSESEQGYLIRTLDAGSLPAQLTEEPISEQTVGPQLGEDNLRAGLYACMFGLVVVFVFLVSYYYLAGLVAFFAVLMNVIIILGVMAMLNATFTLPGVAGIVLTIGAAVDANVLIFERLREEQQRGLTIRMALRNAYDRAWSAILDSNMTTLITSFLLYMLGTEEVKGFGITLLIGLLSSIFTSLYVTKTLFGLLVDKGGITKLGSLPLTFPAWDRMLKPNIDWLGKVWWFIGSSAIIAVVGIAAMVHYKQQLLDIEFASGTSVQFDLKEPMKIEDVRKAVPTDDPNLQAPAVVSVGTDGLSYEIVTISTDAPKVKEVLLRTFGDKLKLELRSEFAMVGRPIDEVTGKAVLPVERDTEGDVRAITGFVPKSWATFRHGAAIVLKDLNPPLRAQDIKDRIERQRLQPQAGGGTGTDSYRDFTVEVPGDPSIPSSVAVVMVADPLVPYDKDAGKWREVLASPFWKLVGEAVNAPPQLQKVTNFNPQIAGETQRDAMIAMAISLFLIMAYIWIRFGNLRYGTATVVAMLHDTLLVVAAIGLSHLLSGTFIGHMLMLEPFRVNLTLVAAILTVMSYSMIDTIVVFDRVRENRGKFGHIDRRIINDSINQTLSRTLLTAGTNIVTLLFMYIFGGPGIHGFTFVLLFGILVGTYSSIAVAAPILLTGGKLRNSPVERPNPAGLAKVPAKV